MAVTDREPTPGTRRIWEGLALWWDHSRIPFGIALLLAVVAVGTNARKGAGTSPGGVSLWAAIAFYFISAALVGAVALLFGSWAKTRLRAASLGFLLGAIGGLVLNLAVIPEPVYDLAGVVILATFGGLVFGAPLAAAHWRPPK